jgi:hypothetical protein
MSHVPFMGFYEEIITFTHPPQTPEAAKRKFEINGLKRLKIL